MREFIGCDSLKFLDIEGMLNAVDEPFNFCKACFDGDYPVKKISGTPERPRLSVYRSEKNIYAQIIDDINAVTLVSANV